MRLQNGGDQVAQGLGPFRGPQHVVVDIVEVGHDVLVHHVQEARTRLLDFFVTHPERESSAEDLIGVVVDYGDSQQIFYTGPMSVAVPGTVLGLWEASARWGSVAWADLLNGLDQEPAVAEIDPGAEADFRRRFSDGLMRLVTISCAMSQPP